MEHFIYAAVIAFIYVIVRSVYSKYSPDDVVPLSQLIKDSVMVFISVIAALYILDSGLPVAKSAKKNISVLTSDPEF
jgi:hypothetical protein